WRSALNISKVFPSTAPSSTRRASPSRNSWADPRELIAFCVEKMDPQHKQFVLDPACGSGGFLLYALDHVRQEANRRFPKHQIDPKQSRDHFTYWHDFAEKNLFGIEVN